MSPTSPAEFSPARAGISSPPNVAQLLRKRGLTPLSRADMLYTTKSEHNPATINHSTVPVWLSGSTPKTSRQSCHNNVETKART
jgi:hypothetical protein